MTARLARLAARTVAVRRRAALAHRRAAPYLRALVFLLILAAPFAIPTGGAASASMITAPTPGTDCLAPPMPQSPNDGVAASIDPGPTTPRTGDPFDKTSGATLYDVYGYGGYAYTRFDPGCGFTWDPNEQVANLVTGVSNVATAAGTRLTRMVTSGGFGSLWDPVQNEAARIIGNGLFLPLIGVAVFITALYFMASAHHADPARAARESMGTAAVLAFGMAAATYTLTVGATVDRGVTGAFTAANQMVTSAAGGERDAADTVAANLLTQIQYNTWRTQKFGSDEAAADKYAADLFRAGAFTRAEQAALLPQNDTERQVAADAGNASPLQNALNAQAGTDAGVRTKAAIDKKQADYKEIAKKIETEFPQAYYHLKGGDSHSAAGHSMVGLMATLSAVGFLIYCLVRMLWSSVVVRVGLGFMGAIALLAQFPRLHKVALSLFMWVVEAVGKAVLFGFAFVVYLAGGIGGIMAPETDWHPLAKAFALVMLSYALWKLSARLGMSGTWSMPRSRSRRKDKHQYGRRWDKETRPERGPQDTPVRPIFSEQTAIGGARVPRAAIGGTGPIGRRGQQVPGMGHVYGETPRPHGGQPGAVGIGSVRNLGKLASVVPGGQGVSVGVQAAISAASKPRGAPGGLALTSHAATRPQTGSERALSFPEPVPGKVIDRSRLHKPVPKVGSTVMSRQSTKKPLPVHNITRLPNKD